MRGAGTDNTQIEVKFEALVDAETGDATIDSYNVHWDQDGSNGTFVSLFGDPVHFLPTLAEGELYRYTEEALTEGEAYNFKVRAHNKWGWGQFSATKTIVAATVPAQPAFVVTSISDNLGQLHLDWVEPDYRGEDVTNYTV